MNKLWKVTYHEFKTLAANKAFIILTILGPFLIIAMSVLPSLMMNSSEIKNVNIGILGSTEELLLQIADPLETVGITIDRRDGGKELFNSLVLEEEIYGYLVIPQDLLHTEKLEFITKDIPDWKIVETLKSIIGQFIIKERMKDAGFEPENINKLIHPPYIESTKITGKGEKIKQDFLSALLTGLAFTMLLYMTILLYGQAIGRAVLKEKTSKTVEIMLSSVSENDLLFGKIIGQAAAGLLQYTVWVGMAMLFIKLIGPRLGLSLPIVEGSIFIYLIVFFILGFLLYSSIFAALGSASEDETHLGQMSWPLIMILVIPMVSVAGIIGNPHSSYSIFLSLFPMTSPMVMYVRLVISDPKAWQIIFSIGALVITVFIFILLSAKIFRVGILMTGKRFNIKDIIKWLRV